MSLKIRLARAGSKKRPYYHIVIADVRSPRDGRFIEAIGAWNPLLPKDGERVKLDTDRVKHWLPCTLPGPRAASAAELAERLQQRGLSAHTTCDTPAAALHLAQEIAGEDDRILVFGSFLTVAAVMQELRARLGH